MRLPDTDLLLLSDLDLLVVLIIVLLASKSCLYRISGCRFQLHFAWAEYTKQELCQSPINGYFSAT
jgi:hypothetical protein